MNLDEMFRQREASASMQFIAFRDIRFQSEIPNRAIDWDFVDQLEAGGTRQLPPADVMFMPNSRDYEMLDGQHRYWAVIHAFQAARPELFPPGPDDSESWPRYFRACLSRIDDTVQVKVWPAMTAQEVMLFRFWRNRDHGLNVSEVDRKEMARVLKNQNPLMTNERIAHEIRRSASFVSKVLNETFREEKESAPDGFKTTRKFCNLVERAYFDGFLLRAQVEARVEWLRDDPQFLKAYEGTARQMLKDIERAKQ